MSDAQDRARTANWNARNLAGFTGQIRRMRGRLAREEDNADLLVAIDALERIEARRNEPVIRVLMALTEAQQSTTEIAKAAGIPTRTAYRALRRLFATNQVEWWKQKGDAKWMVPRE